MYRDAYIVVVMPALNEEPAIAGVLDALPHWLDAVVVVDNGSTDRTADIAAAHGATVVSEPRRGYGSACLAGLAAVARGRTPDVVVFMDADRSDDPADLEALLGPVVAGEADLVIGSRVTGAAESGSLTWPQRFGNAVAVTLLRLLWRVRFTDLGPFRAVRYAALQPLRMDDRGYGWTVQMQARAVSLGLRVREVPVAYRRRVGRSKISGTARGVVAAGTTILVTIAREWRAHRHRLAAAETSRDPTTDAGH